MRGQTGSPLRLVGQDTEQAECVTSMARLPLAPHVLVEIKEAIGCGASVYSVIAFLGDRSSQYWCALPTKDRGSGSPAVGPVYTVSLPEFKAYPKSTGYLRIPHMRAFRDVGEDGTVCGRGDFPCPYRYREKGTRKTVISILSHASCDRMKAKPHRWCYLRTRKRSHCGMSSSSSQVLFYVYLSNSSLIVPLPSESAYLSRWTGQPGGWWI